MLRRCGPAVLQGARCKGHSSKEWETVVGLEVHCQLKTLSKLFSGASAEPAQMPNSQVALLDAGIPGALPVLNAAAVRLAAKTGLALGGEINRRSLFERKHYFYCDMPQGYQITQRTVPFVTGGYVPLDPVDTSKRVAIEYISIEQDSGKSIHDLVPGATLVDLNRAGVPLIEIVSTPDIRSAKEAADYMKSLILLLRTIGACDANMEQGTIRCDVNISVRRPGEPFGPRTEVKNVNGISALMKAIDFERGRQIEAREKGERLLMETRGLDVAKGRTYRQRTKESEADYRFMPEPDLPPLVLSKAFLEDVRTSLPELPYAMHARLMRQYKLNADQSSVLVGEADAVEYFETLVPLTKASIKQCHAWIVRDLFRWLREKGVGVSDVVVKPSDAAALLDLVAAGIIAGNTTAKAAFYLMAGGDKRPLSEIVESAGGTLNSDAAALESICRDVLAKFPDKVAQYHKGRTGLHGFLVAEVLRASGGKANARVVDGLVKQELARSAPGAT